MPYQINEKLKKLEAYTPVDEAEGIIHLDANESFLNLPAALLQKVGELVQTVNFNRYPDPYATELCQAFGAFYGVNPAHVTAGNGSDELISILISAFLMKGETVVTTAPDFSMYTFYPKLAETNCVEVCKGDGFSVTPEELIQKVQSTHARMLLFSNPCNPTSLGLTKEQVLQVVSNVNALVVVDEAYMDFWDMSQSVLGQEDQFDNLLILKTCSKMGMAALRIGFAVANKTLTGIFHAAKSPYNVNTLTQKLAALVLQEKNTLQAETMAVRQSRKYLQQGVQSILARHSGAFQLYQSCTNFVTIRFPRASACYDFLMEKKISVRCFPDFLRITAGSDTENKMFLATLESYFEEA
ncbi:MAG: aminotransferase class I/II-fold pyridoxal phosphate-dependent enzyme [Oscillospiraceae bacterium]|jgi:histidinol-phosphate aminotransferase|nr:aminotransferase class I/II-fold pyridoxal phosphate-dependent enzyme [Oscillospiraceae bacterium]